MADKPLLDDLQGIVAMEGNKVQVLDESRLRGPALDGLVYAAVFGEAEERAAARALLWELGQALGVRPASIHDLYMARGRGETSTNWTVPAMNLRTLTYDMARAVFRAARARNVGAMIFEIARSEIGYTDQRPAEYATVVIGAAIREGYRGPLFIQGDHFQVSAKKYATARDAEVGAVEDLIREAIAAGFFNIDIDTSTLVDLSRPTVAEQQRANYEVCAHFTRLIRSLEPEGVTVSVGGEIGEVGGHNTTEEEVRAFMDGYNGSLPLGMPGVSKLSIQTGTFHGGVVLPDGTLARVKIDFDTLERLSRVAREEYGLAGAVQHGASTLPPEAFHKFPEAGTAEIHLATAFQNLLYDHPLFPADLREEIYAYLRKEHAADWKEGKTEEQFLYEARKKALGPFKRELWNLPAEVRETIGQELEAQFIFLFEQLGVTDTAGMVARYVRPPEIHKTPADFGAEKALSISEGLAD
ncbi:MAG: class II fructose-bisphosphate aldolase [Anaerolineae bacterium]|nr:class II D-tagatose-bisphosphate aldolase, non-catalytic subunit [Anaerolineae bacterium]MDW8067896.1 class II fructose-bisphosphate aldolase [Anaerolineae bacterium]